MLVRTRLLLIAATLSAVLAACGSSATPSPAPSSAPPTTEATATPAPASTEPAATEAPSAAPSVTVYRIRSGDTLYRLAIRFKIKLADLIAANPQLSDPNKLKIGQRINIPAAPSPSAS